MPGGFVYLTLSDDRHLVLAHRRTRGPKFDAFSDSVSTLFFDTDQLGLKSGSIRRWLYLKLS